MIHVRTLGTLEVSVDGAAAPPELLWRKHIALLIYLARSPDRSRARDHLLALLWEDKSDDAARHSLNEAIRILRKHAGKGVDRNQTYVRIDSSAVALDVDGFDAAFASGDFAAAAALANGEFMAGFTVPDAWQFEEWLAQERRTLRDRSVTALANYASELLARGQNDEALALAERALTLDSSAEVAGRIAMTARAIMGDRVGALRCYDQLVAQLEENVGVEPQPESQALAERIRNERSWRARDASDGVLPLSARRTPLIGLQNELGTLLSAWSSAARGARVGIVVIEGDSGTGKTRLLEELAIRIRLDGGSAWGVRAVEKDREQAWITANGLLAAAQRAADPQRNTAEQLRAVIADAARDRPVFISIDDAHWVDEESAALIGTLLRDLAWSPVLFGLVVSSHTRHDTIDALRSRIGREFAGATVKTTQFSLETLGDLARTWLVDYDDAQIDRVSRRVLLDSAGLPFLAVELLQAIAAGVELKGMHAPWPQPMRTFEQTMPSELPDAVVAAIRVSFRQLSGNAQKVLMAASVLDHRVSPEVLRRTTSLNEADLMDALDELEWQRWLLAEPRGYTFVARVAREIVARDMLTEGQRHRILAAAEMLPTA